MFNGIGRKLYSKPAVVVIALLFVIVLVSCENSRTPVAEPEEGSVGPVKPGLSAGELHNRIIKEYFAVVINSGQLSSTGGRIPWQEARKVFLKVGNRILEENGAGFRITEEMLERSMRQLAELRERGIMDVFYPRKGQTLPVILEKMSGAGLVSRDRAKEISGFWNERIVIAEGSGGELFRGGCNTEFEDENVLSVIEHSSDFWSRVADGGDIVDKENEEDDSEDSFWERIREWWIRNRKEIRRITVTSCDAGGAVVGTWAGAGGVVLGSMLASTGATIAWPPYDDYAYGNGGELNCKAE